MIDFFKRQKRSLGRPTPFKDMAKWARVQVVLQLEMWSNIMRLAHEKLGHFGVCHTYNLLHGQYWWTDM
jgi:hypothetical protein